jgi:LPXTG-motif cell wall-anchored protein
MRAGLRRTIGLGGAAFVAVGAALVLTLPASAHQTVATASCAGDGNTTVVINIHTTRDYSTDAQHPKSNKVWILDASGKTIFSDMFGASYSNNIAGTSLTPPLDGTAAHNITVRAKGFDGQGDDTIPLTTPICKQSQPTPTTTTVPPTTTTTVAPPSHEAATTTPVVAAASSQLPNTGVNAGMPLLIAGVLVVAGGGILLWLRIAAKRRSTNN